VTICIADCSRGVCLCKFLRWSSSIGYVLCSTIDSKVGTLVNDGAGFGVRPRQVGGNVLSAEVDMPKLVRVYVGCWKSPRLALLDYVKYKGGN
jgi:hypothetical protein